MASRVSTARYGWTDLAPHVTLLLLLGPVLAGVAGTLLPAFGWMPVSGQTEFTLQPWRALLAEPGIMQSLQTSFTVGVLATLLSLCCALLISAALYMTPVYTRLQRLLPPLLAIPHAAAAFGLLFLIAPSGWLVRWISPSLTGWTVPPDLLITQDPWGFSMVAALVMKEVPFLLLMILAAQTQLNAGSRILLAQSLGYGKVLAWFKAVLPGVYPLIRLPVYAVLAYALSVVDVALILGPTTPAPLAVRLMAWMNDPDPVLHLQAAAGATAQIMLVLLALGLWRLGEVLASVFARHWLEAGWRGQRDGAARSAGQGLMWLFAVISLLGLLGQALWSVAGLWVFPDALPQSYTLQGWQRVWPVLERTTLNTILLGVLALVLALVLSVACLENEYRSHKQAGARGLWLLYLPLLVPQAGFLPGLQILFASVGIDGSFLAVLLAHLVFVLPYVFLTLADPYRCWDERQAQVAATLGASPDRILWRIRLPQLLATLLAAGAIGFAVSVGQYLPTLLLGGGRISTLTTEAVALAAGGERRMIGSYALMQMALPLLAYSIALSIPALGNLWRSDTRRKA